ncbi:MAG TPA: aromatic amino acid lyase, partial [Bacteroidales bacterium]|nr:aromatic amino acid lyase [Bacteroidales bacterium]
MKIIVDTLNIDDYSKILFKNCKIEIDEKAEKRVEESYNFLKKFSIDKLIYGINTGFGPMAQYRVD